MVKIDRSVCWQLMLLDLLRLSCAIGEASSSKLSGKLRVQLSVTMVDQSINIPLLMAWLLCTDKKEKKFYFAIATAQYTIIY